MRFPFRIERMNFASLFFILIVLSAMIMSVFPFTGKAAHFGESQRLDSGWQYRWGDSPRTDSGAFEWAVSPSNDGWELADQPDMVRFRPVTKTGNAEDMLWMRVKLPSVACSSCSIWIEDITRLYEVYLNGVKVYGFGAISPGKHVPFSGESANLINLPDQSQGDWLTLRIQSDTRFIGVSGQIWFGSRESVLQTFLENSRWAVLIGNATILAGLLYIGAWLLNRKHRPYLWFGGYLLSMGIMLTLREKPVILAFGEKSWTTAIVLAAYLFTTAIFLRYFISIFNEGPYRVLHWVSMISLAVTAGMIVTSVPGFYSPYQWNDGVAPILLFFTVVAIVWTIIVNKEKFNTLQKVALSGFLLMIVTAVFDAFAAIVTRGQLPVLAHFSMLIFIFLQSGLLFRSASEQNEQQSGNLMDLQNQLTESRQALAASQKALQTANQSVSEMNTKIQDLNRQIQVKDQALGSTVHDLRSPLNGIIGITESLLEEVAGKLNANMRSNLQMVLMSAKRMNNLIGDIIDFSKMKNQTLQLQKQRIGLYDMVQSIISLFAPLVENKPVYLINQIDPAFPVIMADENRLNQIINNILSNSVKFTMKGNITVRAEVDGNQAIVRIRDNGSGIPAEQLNQLLQGGDQHEFASSGQRVGFGLSVTKQLIELHKGKLTVTSNDDEFTEFAFTLPLADDPSEKKPVNAPRPTVRIQMPDQAPVALTKTPEQSTPAEAEGDQEDGKDFLPDIKESRVLIVDDEPINIQVLQNLLGPLGYALTTARDGFEALNIIKEQGAFDLILLDVMMPRLSGYDVCLRIRKTYSANELPILLLTAKNTVDDLVRGFQVGANDYLTKPFAKQELIARVEMQLKLSKNHQHIKSKSERNAI